MVRNKTLRQNDRPKDGLEVRCKDRKIYRQMDR